MTATPTDSPDLLTIPEAADTLRMTPGNLRVLLSRGKGPPSVKVGRRRLIDRNALNAWLAEGGTPQGETP